MKSIGPLIIQKPLKLIKSRSGVWVEDLKGTHVFKGKRFSFTEGNDYVIAKRFAKAGNGLAVKQIAQKYASR